MRSFSLTFRLMAVLAFSVPGLARADACRDSIAAMYFSGPLDPTQRPPHRQTTGTLMPDGTYTPESQSIWSDHLTMISGNEGNYLLVAGSVVWTGPTLDGPWTRMPSPMPEDRAALDLRQRQQNVKNLSETSCDGTYEIEGRQVERFTFRTRTDPDDKGMFFGALNTVYIDARIGQVVRWDFAENIASWAPEKSVGTMITQIVYDPSITITVPAE